MDLINCIPLIERLTRLESHVELRFAEFDRSIKLARENAEDNRKEAKRSNDVRLEHMNEFQKRMDRLEGTFATKEQIQAIYRLVYIGVGIVLTLQFVLYFIK